MKSKQNKTAQIIFVG